MRTLFIGNLGNSWLMQGAMHFAYENLPDCDPLQCYTPDDPKLWTESVGEFVKGIDDPYLLVMLDDYWIMEVDEDLLMRAEELMEGGAVDKIDLSGDRMQFPFEPWASRFVMSAQTARYRTSLQAAIWKRSYLLNFCTKGTPWEFELKGSESALNDGATILGTIKPCIRYVNVLRKGQWHGKCDF